MLICHEASHERRRLSQSPEHRAGDRVGLIALAAIWPLMILWPSGWAWHHGHSDYPMMIVGLYATPGVFLLITSRDPFRHLSLIWFTVWS